MTLSFQTYDARLATMLTTVFQKDGIEILPMQPLAAEVLLIHTPAPCQKIYARVDLFWKKHLHDFHPEKKLCILSNRQFQDLNYIDLLHFPTQPRTFFEQAQPVDMMATPPETYGLELLSKLKNFFTGHGSESIIDILDRVKIDIDAMHSAVRNSDKGLSIIQDAVWNQNQEIQVGWAIFKNRWLNYFPLFKWLPIQKEMAILNEKIDQIEPFFKLNAEHKYLFHKLEIKPTFDYLMDQLSFIEKTYVK